jgi:hypothetical protein
LCSLLAGAWSGPGGAESAGHRPVGPAPPNKRSEEKLDKNKFWRSDEDTIEQKEFIHDEKTGRSSDFGGRYIICIFNDTVQQSASGA